VSYEAVNISRAAVTRAAAVSVSLAGAGAAVLVVGAARAAVERAATRIGEYDAQLDRAIRARARGEIDGQLWPRTVAHVVEINARIVLHEMRSRPTPGRLNLVGCEPWQAAAWCVRIAESLRIAARGGLEPTLPPVSVLEADVQVALRSVDQDANDAERDRARAAAAHVAERAPRTRDVRAFLLELTTAVNEINKAVARRRLAAQWLLALEQPIVAAAMPAYAETVAGLRAVVAGETELDDGLRDGAAHAISRADEVVRLNFLRREAAG